MWGLIYEGLLLLSIFDPIDKELIIFPNKKCALFKGRG